MSIILNKNLASLTKVLILILSAIQIIFILAPSMFTAATIHPVSFVEGWPVTDPSDILFILICYLVFIVKLGPNVMKTRPPYKMKWWLIFYNDVRVVDSALLAYRFVFSIMDKGVFPATCEHEEWTRYEIAFLYWRFMVSKILDLSDTIYMVLQKKYSQVTCLHVFHRVVMFPLAWFCVRYDPSDHWAFMGAVNCSVNTVVYIYYGVAALGPRFSRLLWWKKNLTMMQVVQFFLITGHLVVQTLISECPVHPLTNWICLACTVLIICVGIDYYLVSGETRKRGNETEVDASADGKSN